MAFGQSPSWDWAKRAGSDSNDIGWCISQDSSGNIYVVGTFASDSILFGTTYLVNNNIAATVDDIFITKYDINGNILWAKKAGGNLDDYPFSATVDASGNIYITGFFRGSISFDAITLFSAGFRDLFVVKYDTNGNALWAKRAGGADDDEAEAIAVDALGQVYITGFFQSPSITFGSTTLTNTTSSYYFDLFIAKYDSSGNPLWARKAGGVKHDYGTAICTDAFNNVILAGHFLSPTISFGTSTLTNSTLQNIYIAKYNSAGTLLWLNNEGNGYINDIATNNTSEIFATGELVLVPLVFGTDTLTTQGNADMFVAKFDTGGNSLWGRSGGGTAFDYGLALAVDALSNVYVTGMYQSQYMSFPYDTLTNSDTTTNSEVYIVGYDNLGNVLWSKGIYGNSNQMELGSSISTFGGDVYLTGYFYSDSISFDSFYLYNDTTYGSTDMFVAKLVPSILTNLNEQKSLSDDSFIIFPNPSSGRITISSAEQFEKIIITDLFGQIIFQEKSNNKSISLNLEKTGIYFITVVSEKQTSTKKLILQR